MRLIAYSTEFELDSKDRSTNCSKSLDKMLSHDTRRSSLDPDSPVFDESSISNPLSSSHESLLDG
jgi:hypothetical protein